MSCKKDYENCERKIVTISGVAHVPGARLSRLTTRTYYPDTPEIRDASDKLSALLDVREGEVFDALPSKTETASIEAMLRLQLAKAEAELELDTIKNQHPNWNRPNDVVISQRNVTTQKQIIEDFLSSKTPSTDVQLRLDSLQRAFNVTAFERETGERYDFKVHEPKEVQPDDPAIRAAFDQFIAERPLLTATRKSFCAWSARPSTIRCQ